MAGNSKRIGAVRKTGSKKGAVVGSGGQRRKALEGRGPTPKAVDRPNHKAHKAAARGGQASARPGSAGRGGYGGPQRRRLSTRAAEHKASVRWWPGAMRSSRHSAPPCPPRPSMSRAGSTRRPRAGGDQACRGKRHTDAGNPSGRTRSAHRRRRAPGPRDAGAALCLCAPNDLIDPEEPGIPLIVALDGITDPRNLGAIVRSVAAFGGHGVVVPARRSVGMTASAWKTSAGAAARIPVAQATNLTRRWRTTARRASSWSASTWRAMWTCPTSISPASRSSSWWGPRARACLGWFARPAIKSSRFRCRARSSPSTPASPRASRFMRSPDDDAEYRQLPAVGVPRLLGSE
jgi:23S rRNA (guanosine2251-2'-O)-methyltransferase